MGVVANFTEEEPVLGGPLKPFDLSPHLTPTDWGAIALGCVFYLLLLSVCCKCE